MSATRYRMERLPTRTKGKSGRFWKRCCDEHPVAHAEQPRSRFLSDEKGADITVIAAYRPRSVESARRRWMLEG